jgi:glycosyltransferase involved in cell wall biosynthesis
MKILFCLNLQEIGGIETSTLELLKCLALRQKNQYFLIVRNYQKEKLEKLGITLDHVAIFECSEVTEAASIISDISPDIIQLYKSLFFFEALEVADIHLKKILVYHANQKGKNFFLTDEVDRVVCVSKSVHSFLTEKGVKNLITIPNGVSDLKMTKKRGVKIIFSHLGRLDIQEKKIDELLKFWRNRKHFINAQLHIFGGDGQLELGDVVERKFTNREVALSETDYLLSFSRSEGFGMAIAEALMVNIPVICRHCGGVTEDLIDNVDVFYFDDEESFNDVLFKLESGELNAVAVAESGRQKIQELYNINKATLNYESLYLELYESHLATVTKV